MNYVSIAFSRIAKLLAVLAVGAALAGCMMTSKTELVAEAEGATPLPDTVYLYGYEDDKDAGAGHYKRSTDAPMALNRKDRTYVSADDSIHVRFVPLSEPDTYMLAMVSTDGNVYGIGRLRDGLIVVSIIIADADPAKVIAAEIAKGGEPATVLKDVVSEEGGVAIPTRAALDYLVAMGLDGRLQLAPIVMYTDAAGDASAPAKVALDGAFAKAG